jgi:hypothetical protein
MKSIAWTDPNAGQGVAEFYLYYAPGEAPPFDYDMPHVVIPAVPDKSDYVYALPGQIPLTEGTWTLWVAAADADGNISDPASVTRFFDFTPPLAPVDLRVL